MKSIFGKSWKTWVIIGIGIALYAMIYGSSEHLTKIGIDRALDK